MADFFDFVKSDIGVGLAWLCTIGSTLFAIFTAKRNRDLSTQIKKITINATADNSQDHVAQIGTKNVYTKNNSGGMKINM